MSKQSGNPFLPHYLRPKAAAAHVGLGIRTLSSLVSAGKVRPPYKISKTIALFRRAQLEADLDTLCGHIGTTQEGRNEWDDVLQ